MHRIIYFTFWIFFLRLCLISSRSRQCQYASALQCCICVVTSLRFTLYFLPFTAFFVNTPRSRNDCLPMHEATAKEIAGPAVRGTTTACKKSVFVTRNVTFWNFRAFRCLVQNKHEFRWFTTECNWKASLLFVLYGRVNRRNAKGGYIYTYIYITTFIEKAKQTNGSISIFRRTYFSCAESSIRKQCSRMPELFVRRGSAVLFAKYRCEHRCRTRYFIRDALCSLFLSSCY